MLKKLLIICALAISACSSEDNVPNADNPPPTPTPTPTQTQNAALFGADSNDDGNSEVYIHYFASETTEKLIDSVGDEYTKFYTATSNGDYIYIVAEKVGSGIGQQLYKINKETLVSTLVHQFNAGGPSFPNFDGAQGQKPLLLNGIMYIVATNGSANRLWKIDLSNDSATDISGAASSWNLSPALLSYDGKVFGACTTASAGTELCSVSQVDDTLEVYDDIISGVGNGGNFITTVATTTDGLYFRGSGAEGREMWKYDPVSDSVSLFADFFVGGGTSHGLANLFSQNNKIYGSITTATLGINNFELHSINESDGSPTIIGGSELNSFGSANILFYSPDSSGFYFTYLDGTKTNLGYVNISNNSLESISSINSTLAEFSLAGGVVYSKANSDVILGVFDDQGFVGGDVYGQEIYILNKISGDVSFIDINPGDDGMGSPDSSNPFGLVSVDL